MEDDIETDEGEDPKGDAGENNMEDEIETNKGEDPQHDAGEDAE